MTRCPSPVTDHVFALHIVAQRHAHTVYDAAMAESEFTQVDDVTLTERMCQSSCRFRAIVASPAFTVQLADLEAEGVLIPAARSFSITSLPVT